MRQASIDFCKDTSVLFTEQSQPHCPNLTEQFQLGQIDKETGVLLKTLNGSRSWRFTESEGFALRYFTGQFTIAQVQAACEQEFASAIAADFVQQLCDKLDELEVFATEHIPQSAPDQNRGQSPLKPEVHWIEHPEGYWILRNPINVTFLQVNDTDKQIIEALGFIPTAELIEQYQIEAIRLNQLLKMLAATGMLIGTEPAKPPKGKFTPMKLLFFRIPLFNPDQWLSRHVNRLHWIWTTPVAMLVAIALIASAIVGASVQSAIVLTGQQLWATEGATILIPFVLLCGVVIALHELGHAFTLKHFGGIVPEIGLLFMCLSPGCYTNTTDSYCLIKRRQRTLVVGAGILCQLILWALGLWLWLMLTPGTWLKTGSYLLMVAAVFTFAINLNPLAKFDGYYLAVAITGINNLRTRSFLFYLNFIQRKPIRETIQDRWILALYAPLSLGYSLLIFGHLIAWLIDWVLSNIPAFAILLLITWAAYYYFPSSGSSMTSASPSSPNSRPHPEDVASRAESSKLTLPRIPRRAIWIGSILLGVGALSLIPIPNTITGNASINSTPGARQAVTMPESGLVKTIWVHLNDSVKAGQVVAELSSSELDRQRLDVERKLAEAISERETAQQQLNLALSRRGEIETRVQATSQTAARMQQELGQLSAGQEPPRIRQFQQQQSERQREIVGLQTQLDIVNAQITVVSQK